MRANRKRIVELCIKEPVTISVHSREAVDAGGLMYYAADRADGYRRAATHVDRILKGAKPADMPVEQPTRFEFVINLEGSEADRPDNSAERVGESGQGDPMKVVSSQWSVVSKSLFSIALCAMLLALSILRPRRSLQVRRVGVLRADAPGTLPVETFQQAMRDLGYLEGKNIVIEYRYAEGRVERLPNLAEELVGLNVEVIWAAGPAISHAKNATRTIPIVITNVSDPVGSGYVASVARPGGNITGLASLQRGLAGKRLEVLKGGYPQALPGSFSSVIRKSPATHKCSKETEVAAKTFGLQIQNLDVQTPKEIEPAVQAASKGRARALLVLRNPLTAIHHPQIAELAGKSRLPTMYGDREFVEAGGLMSYGPDQIFIYRRVAAYVDKILKGTKPADLPVEGPSEI